MNKVVTPDLIIENSFFSHFIVLFSQSIIPLYWEVTYWTYILLCWICIIISSPCITLKICLLLSSPMIMYMISTFQG